VNMNIHEQEFVKAFVQSERRVRFLEFLNAPKKRRKVIREFDHLKSRFLDVRFMIPLRGSEALPPNVFATLRKMGAPANCWVMGGRFDEEERELLEAIRDSGDGFVLSCIPGKLAYMKTEDEEYILSRLRAD
jgi:hypothetical protein